MYDWLPENSNLGYINGAPPQKNKPEAACEIRCSYDSRCKISYYSVTKKETNCMISYKELDEDEEKKVSESEIEKFDCKGDCTQIKSCGNFIISLY